MRKASIAVVGSINMDLVLALERLPRPGETLAAEDLRYVHGGKGANQAVAAARLGARVAMVGRVGDDPFGARLKSGLDAEGILTEHVLATEGCPSGVAVIGVEASGENSIVIVPGANGRLTPLDVQAAEGAIRSADVLLLQLEVPAETVEAAARLAWSHGVRVVLDPAPAPGGPLHRDLLAVDVISPNQTEAEALTGIAVRSRGDAEAAAAELRRRGARNVVVKLGEDGALLCDERGRSEHSPARRVAAVDTTAAGDAFTAALAVAWAEGRPLADAVRFGCAAGTVAVTRRGAQPSMPRREEVEKLLAGS